jgi:flagellar basal body-associated protein FliL
MFKDNLIILIIVLFILLLTAMFSYNLYMILSQYPIYIVG